MAIHIFCLLCVFCSTVFQFSVLIILGRKGSEIADLPVKKHSFNTHEAQSSPISRKPFSPILSSKPFSPILSKESPKANAANKLEVIESNTSFLTPSKTVSAVGEEEANKTPNTMRFHVPSTPLTTSIPMYTSTTPAPPPVASVATTVIREAPEEIEYSFEELRAGFILPEHLKSLLHL